MRIDPLKYAQAEDEFMETAKLVVERTRFIMRAGTVIAFVLIFIGLLGLTAVALFLVKLIGAIAALG